MELRGSRPLKGALFATVCYSVLTSCSAFDSGSLQLRPAPQQGQGTAYVGFPKRNLYLANDPVPGKSNVVVFARGGPKILRRITRGVKYPFALAFNPSGNLYVANYGTNDITVYRPHQSRPFRTISKGVDNAQGLAFDGSDYLYVANLGDYKSTSVAVYTSSGLLKRIVRNGINEPAALATNSSGQLFVANYLSNAVTVYTPGATKLLRTISNGIHDPLALVFDGSGNLYVANETRNKVTVYAPGGTKLLRSIKTEKYPAALAFDAASNLYVLNNGANSVEVYSPGSDTPKLKIKDGLDYPVALAFGNAKELYVANYSTVTVYDAESGKLLRTISRGVAYPRTLAFGP